MRKRITSLFLVLALCLTLLPTTALAEEAAINLFGSNVNWWILSC